MDNEVKDTLKEIETAVKSRLDRFDEEVGRIDHIEKVMNRPGYNGNKTEKKFSLKNAILHLSKADGEVNFDAGYEKEVSQEIKSRQPDIKLAPGEMFVPISAFTEQKNLTVSGDGSNLVPEAHLGGQFVDILRNNSIVIAMARILMDLKGDVDIPKKTAGSTAYWFSGDGSDTITESDISLDSLGLTPHFVAGLTKYSYKTLTQSDPAVNELISDDLIETIGVEIDRAAINGSGTGSEPQGILNFANIGSVSFAGTDGPTWAEVVALEQELADNNALRGNLNYLSNSGLLTHLKTTEKATGTAEFLHADGQMNDYPSRFTGNVPAGQILFGNFSELIVGMWSAIKLKVDPYSEFSSGTTAVRAILPIDFTVRHDESFAEGTVSAA